MAVEIRKAEESDIPSLLELLDLIRDLHHKSRPDVFRSTGTKYTAAELAEKLKREDERVFVACEDGSVLGYIFTVMTEYLDRSVLADRKVLYIDDLCVFPASRGRGVGRMLMDRAKEYAKERGCDSMELVCWNFDGSAEGFYRGCGFTTMSKRMEHRLNDDED